jgi:hypothetical protein
METDTTQNNNCADVALQSKDSRHSQSSMGQMCSHGFTESSISIRFDFILPSIYWQSLIFLTLPHSHLVKESISYGEPLLTKAQHT